MEEVGLLLGAVHAQQHQQAVAGVDHGVDAFGEHGGRARYSRCDELDDAYCDVAYDCRHDGYLALTLGGGLSAGLIRLGYVMVCVLTVTLDHGRLASFRR